MPSKKITVACIGTGYFSRFHIDGWKRIPNVDLVALCDFDLKKANELANTYSISNVYSTLDELLENESIDVLDIITPPDTHFDICDRASKNGIHIICQKPLAPTYDEAVTLVELIESRNVRFMVHENWRFQPWYRQIKELIDDNSIGVKMHSLSFQMRMGDGWGDDAYLGRQPYFREMPRLLVYETGIHFIDTFRYLLGEVDSVYADLRQLNHNIQGEDCGLIIFNFKNGARGIWDANRYNESNNSNPRYTFGEMILEGNGGSIRLYNDGKITLQILGKSENEIAYTHEDKNFAGDCVYNLQNHLAQCLINNLPFENSGREYLKNLEVQEAVYESALEQRVVKL